MRDAAPHTSGLPHASASQDTEASFEHLTTARHEDGIVVLTMRSKRGPVTLSKGMLIALQESLDELAHDDKTHVIVLASEGSAFCAGHDLKEMTTHRADPDGGRAYYTPAKCLIPFRNPTIKQYPKPVVAVVQGHAAAAGCQLVATCDLAIASEDAQFGTTGINNGLFCSTPMVALSRKVHRKHALEMLFTGDLISADRAYEMGLVSRVAPSSDIMAEALALARVIAAQSPAAIAFGKTAFYKQIDSPLAEAYDIAADVMVENIMHCDAIEGIGAFIEKRPPTWRGNKS